MSMKEAYQEKLQARLDEMKTEIKALKAKIDVAEADARLKYYEDLEKIREKQEHAQNRLDELRRSGEDALEDMRIGIESAWTSLSDAISRASNRFK